MENSSFRVMVASSLFFDSILCIKVKMRDRDSFDFCAPTKRATWRKIICEKFMSKRGKGALSYNRRMYRPETNKRNFLILCEIQNNFRIYLKNKINFKMYLKNLNLENVKGQTG